MPALLIVDHVLGEVQCQAVTYNMYFVICEIVQGVHVLGLLLSMLLLRHTVAFLAVHVSSK